MINDCLKPYCTQRAGGFEVSELLLQTEIKERLTDDMNAFDGIVLGVESSSDSRLPIEGTHCAEVSVYNRYLDISPQMILTGNSGKQKMKLHVVHHSDEYCIWLGHTSSGTRDTVKSNVRIVEDISGWGIGSKSMFDGIEIYSLGMSILMPQMQSILQRLCDWSQDFGVQFVLPRWVTSRYGNRPFANNQMHKDTQIASMLAVVPIIWL